jgi:hypothetical protein
MKRSANNMIWATFSAAGTVGVLLLLFASSQSLMAQETNSASATGRVDYQNFRIISERNIFNPNRSGRSDRTDYRTRREPERGRTRSSPAFALIGTMSYEKGQFAFFDGTSVDYRKVLKPDESIEGYKVTEVGGNFVMLQGNGKEIYLEVGGRMRKQQEGDWTVSSGGEAFESFTAEEGETAPAEGEKTEGASTNAAPAAAGEVSDILKRLMQKREQELQK